MAEKGRATSRKDKGKAPKKESIVWIFFKLDEGEKKVSGKYVECTVCNRRFSRGASSKYTKPTTNMLVHLKNYHPIELKKKQEEKRRQEERDEEEAGPSQEKTEQKKQDKIRNIEYMHVKCGKCKENITKGEKNPKDMLTKMDCHVFKKK